jgi:hypothetical protein
MSTRLYRNIWRFNALTIAICGLLGVVIALFTAFQIASDVFRTSHQVQDVARIEPADTSRPAVQTGFSTGQFEAIKGTAIAMAPLIAKQSYDYSYASKDATSERNYLFYDTASGVSRKLLPSETQIVLSHTELRRDGESGDTPPKAMFFQLVETDSNADGVLSYADAPTLALSRNDGSDLTRLDLKAATMHGKIVTGDGATLVLFMTDDAGLKAQHVDLKTFKIVRTDTMAR